MVELAAGNALNRITPELSLLAFILALPHAHIYSYTQLGSAGGGNLFAGHSAPFRILKHPFPRKTHTSKENMQTNKKPREQTSENKNNVNFRFG